MWLSIGLCRGEVPDGEPDSAGEAPDEEMIIWSVAAARERLDAELGQLGYIQQRRRRGRTVYTNRQRWKPTVILHDSGWMELHSPSLRPRLILIPPFIGAHGTITSQRKIETQKSRVVAQTAPMVTAWRDAIAAEATWEPGYVPPEHAVERPDGGDIVREVIGLTTGADPLKLAEHPLLGRLGDHGFPDPDEDMVMGRYLETLYGLTGVLSPAVLDALIATPRHPLLPHALWEIAGDDRPITTAEGTMAAPGAVAWQLTLADIQPGESVLELSGESGWRAAVMTAMGAVVSRSGGGPFAVILLESGHTGESEALARLAPGGRLLILSPGRITIVAGDARRTVLMVH
jgi:hypothetical protein